jgi:hypothetical protein
VKGAGFMRNEAKKKISDLTRKINKQKRLRDAYSFIGYTNKVKENDKAIYELETKLINIKLEATI